jgi:uncharacterized membrane protein YhaH (DUF805 family)
MEYWMFFLFVVLALIVLSIADSLLHFGGEAGTWSVTGPGSLAEGAHSSGGILTDIFTLAVLVPHLAVAVRRLHDIDRSGWWLVAPFGFTLLGFLLTSVPGAAGGLGMLALLIGSVASVVLLVWLCMNGTRGPNRFGPDPKGGTVG